MFYFTPIPTIKYPKVFIEIFSLAALVCVVQKLVVKFGMVLLTKRNPVTDIISHFGVVYESVKVVSNNIFVIGTNQTSVISTFYLFAPILRLLNFAALFVILSLLVGDVWVVHAIVATYIFLTATFYSVKSHTATRKRAASFFGTLDPLSVYCRLISAITDNLKSCATTPKYFLGWFTESKNLDYADSGSNKMPISTMSLLARLTHRMPDSGYISKSNLSGQVAFRANRRHLNIGLFREFCHVISNKDYSVLGFFFIHTDIIPNNTVGAIVQ